MSIYKDKLNHHSFFKKERFHNSSLTLANGTNGWSVTSIVKAHKMLKKQQASIYLHILSKVVWSISKKVKFLSNLQTLLSGTNGLLATSQVDKPKMLSKLQTSISPRTLLMEVLTISRRLKSHSSLLISENGMSGLSAILKKITKMILNQWSLNIFLEQQIHSFFKALHSKG